MRVIKFCDYFLETNLSSAEVSEYIETKIIDIAIENGEDFAFSVDDFIDNLIEINNNFQIIDDADEWEIEYTPEDIDEIIEDVEFEQSFDFEDEDIDEEETEDEE